MTIIQICPYNLEQYGGVQHHVVQLSETLVEKGHSVYIIAPYTVKTKKTQWDINPHIPIIRLTKAKRIRLWGTSIDISYLKRAEKSAFDTFIASTKPHVIHFHTIWNPVFQHQILNRVPNGITKVATFHDTPPDYGIGSWIGGGLIRRAFRYYLRRLDGAISVSKSQVSAMGINPTSMPTKLHMIPNGIRLGKDMGINEMGEDKDYCSFIFIGRLEPRKGVFDLLKAYKYLKEHQKGNLLTGLKTRDTRLTIVGNGPLLGPIKKFIDQNGLLDVQILTSADEHTKQHLLKQSEVLVAPSLYGESFGIVLLEGMAAGLKILGYGNKGYLNIGRVYGIENFPEPGNVKALTEKMLEFVSNPELTHHLIQKGYEIAQRHDWNNLSDKVLAVYQ